ncbi:unnamed protein product [Caenorhabditis sp. 36 PRJEB53466]|nr:unnamed protein product [Caenorhabditis sp. 36 PRJEB53466]
MESCYSSLRSRVFVATGSCPCSHASLDESNMQELIGNHSFYQNTSLYLNRPVNDICDGNACPDIIDCPVGFILVAFDTNDAKLYPSGNITPTCSPSSKTWTVGSDELSRLYVICVDFSSLPTSTEGATTTSTTTADPNVCQCELANLDASNIKDLVGTHSFYENVTSHPFEPPNEQCYNEICPNIVECAAGYTLVVFDTTDAILYNDSITPYCFPDTKRWRANSIDFDTLYSVCVDFSIVYTSTSEAPPVTVDMNRCECPPIRLIDQAGIERLEASAYLSHRATFAPNVIVDDECEVSVDVSSMQITDFFFMIFRSEAPPIFNRRFSSLTNKSVPFTPYGLSCVQDGSEWQWQYFGGKVDDCAFALQQTDCGECSAISTTSGAIVSQQNGQCDVLNVQCTDGGDTLYYSETHNSFVLSHSQEAVTNEATCVGGAWYLNGILLNDDVTFACSDYINLVAATTMTYVGSACGCPQITDLYDIREYLQLYDTDNIYANHTIDAGKVAYRNWCASPIISCAGSANLVIFGRNVKPRVYPATEQPYTICSRSPLGIDEQNAQMFWFIDGIMLTEAAFACVTAP